jgi:hypothetical protein
MAGFQTVSLMEMVSLPRSAMLANVEGLVARQVATSQECAVFMLELHLFSELAATGVPAHVHDQMIVAAAAQSTNIIIIKTKRPTASIRLLCAIL